MPLCRAKALLRVSLILFLEGFRQLVHNGQVS